MNTREVILAFLAGRSPAAFCEDTIKLRVEASGLLDNPLISLGSELNYLASERMGKLVDVVVDPVTKATAWYATDAGVKQWQLSGRLCVR